MRLAADDDEWWWWNRMKDNSDLLISCSWKCLYYFSAYKQSIYAFIYHTTFSIDFYELANDPAYRPHSSHLYMCYHISKPINSYWFDLNSFESWNAMAFIFNFHSFFVLTNPISAVCTLHTNCNYTIRRLQPRHVLYTHFIEIYYKKWESLSICA